MALDQARRQIVARIAFILLIVASVAPLVIQSVFSEAGPSIEIIDVHGDVRTISLLAMTESDPMTRDGSYQNQYGNWRDQGTYTGVLLSDLIPEDDYASIEVVASDGYRMTIDRRRVDDGDYPMALAFRMDGVDVPDWEDGFRIVVLPEDGGVSNADYGVESAGSYWVTRVSQLILRR